MPDCEFIIGTIVDVASAAAAITAVVVALYVSHRSERPDVIVYLEHSLDRTMVELVCANLGKGVARDISFKGIDVELVQKQHREQFEKSFVRTGIPVLVPGGSRRTAIAVGGSLAAMKDVKAVATVSYYRKGMLCDRKREAEEFLLEYKSFSGNIGVKSDIHEMKLELQKIAKSLNSIAGTLDQ